MVLNAHEMDALPLNNELSYSSVKYRLIPAASVRK